MVSKIDREHESLSKLLRNTNEFDKENMIHLVISDESVSSFYNDLEAYTSIDKAIKSSTDLIKGIKTQTETAKKDLEQKQNAQIDAKVELENAQKKVVQTETEKKQLLAISKDKEASYAKQAAEKKVRADKIRAALFQLRDTKAIPFAVCQTSRNKNKCCTGFSFSYNNSRIKSGHRFWFLLRYKSDKWRWCFFEEWKVF